MKKAIEEITVSIKQLDPGLPLPSYAHPGDAGIDLLASEGMTLQPAQRALVPTGVAIAIPEGYAGYVQPRSGLAFREGLGIVNSPGLVDSGYRGEIRVVVINLDPAATIKIERGDKIAQLVILPVPKVRLEVVDELSASKRGIGGFGSTGRRSRF